VTQTVVVEGSKMQRLQDILHGTRAPFTILKDARLAHEFWGKDPPGGRTAVFVGQHIDICP
jgi:hypothetical protein